MERERLPADMAVDVIFLAPACTLKRFAETAKAHKDRLANLRSFGMQDQLECLDAMLPVLYPRSLLYFVSGLLEEETDEPLLGMQRYFDIEKYPEAATATALMGDWKPGAIWSKTSANSLFGSASGSHHHGDFDSDSETLSSLVYLIRAQADAMQAPPDAPISVLQNEKCAAASAVASTQRQKSAD